MIAKDLLTALNDIDPKLLEDVEPWGAAPKTIRRHPVWAVAAALALCLGIGTAVVLLTGQLSLVSPEGSMMVAEDSAQTVEVPDLEFAVNETGTSSSTGVLYAEGVTQRDLTLDELEYLRSQPGLSWMKEYYLLGSGIFGEDGNIIQVTVSGYTPSTVEESPQPFPVGAAPAFLLALGENELPTDIEDQLFFLEEPNNTVEGVEVKAAQSEYQESYIDPVSGETTYVDSTLYCTGYTLDGASVGLIAVGDGDTLTTEDAEHLAEVAAGYGVHYGLSLEGIGVEPLGDDTPNVNYGDSYHLIVLGPLGSPAPLEFAPYSSISLEDYSSPEEFTQVLNSDFLQESMAELPDEDSTERELTQEEIRSIWGGQLPWDEGIPVTGWAVYSPEGNLEYVSLSSYQDNQGIGSWFTMRLQPGPLDWETQRLQELSYDIIQEPNNQVNGQDVYAVTNTLETFREEDTTGRMIPLEHLTAYRASFQKGESPVAVTVYGYAQRPAGDELTPEEQTADALAQDEAQALVETVTGRSLYGPLTLDALGGPDASSTSVQEESPPSSRADASPTLTFAENADLELSFTPRPATDRTFSNVWNTFSTLYLEPQNLATHGAEPDYTLTEEELASLWEDAPPWEGFLTENDTVEAYGYFSDTGQLINIFIGGYRDSPEIPGTQAYQLFAVCLYNSSLSGAWGQDVEAVLALADTSFQGVDIATERTDSTETYEDGSTMDFTCYSAAFQPSGGPTLATVDGFYSPVALTHEEARDFVERATEEILTHGVDMSGITGSP